MTKFFRTHDQLKLYMKSNLVESSKASIVFVHGVGEHIERYAEAFQAFSEQGYSCFGFDQRGFGRSEGERGHISAFSDYVDDLAIFIDEIVEPVSGKAIFLLGHSMGSIVALAYAINYATKIRGLLVFSCPLELVDRMARLGALLIKFWPTALMPKLKVPNFIDPRMLSDNMANIQALSADPYAYNKVSINWLREFNLALSYIAMQAKQLKQPIVINHGDQDKIAGLNGAKSLYAVLGAQDKTMHVYYGLKHELLNHSAVERSKVLTSNFNWLAQQMLKIEDKS
jgi:alpha-beta hydrolase superfamily lysophospholipase